MTKPPTEISPGTASPTFSRSDTDSRLELFALFVHDLESPIASVKYLLKLIDEGRLDLSKPMHQRIVHSSRIAMQRAESVLFDVLAVARAGEAGLPVHMARIPAGDVISDSIALVAASAEENNVSVICAPVDRELALHADLGLLRRVLDNLLYNALRHTPGGGEIHLATERENDMVRILVSDSGPGLGDIDPEFLFSKYGQAQLRAEGKHRGVGLGLHFCKLAAEGMGGSIAAATHPQGGAVFTVTVRVWGE